MTSPAHHPSRPLAGHHGGELLGGDAEGLSESGDAGAGWSVAAVDPVAQGVGGDPESRGSLGFGPVALPGRDGCTQICILHSRACMQFCIPSRGNFAKPRTLLAWGRLDFYDVFISSLKNSGLSNTAFAAKAGASKQHVNDMLKKRRTPPLDRLEAWADALSLTGEERAAFIRLAYLAHAPEQVRRLVEQLEADLAQAREQHALLLEEVARITASRAKPAKKR